MKKLLLLLLPFFAMAQSPDATQIENILLLNNTEQTSATRVIVQDAFTKELKFVLKASLVPQANATTSGTVRTTTAEVNPQVYTIGIADNLLNAKYNKLGGELSGDLIMNGSLGGILPPSNNATLNTKGELQARKVSVFPNQSGFAIIADGTQKNILNVDNTSDANKPVSSATQSALNAKISGSGTTNQLAKFTASGAVGPSSISDDGTKVGVGTILPPTIFSIRDIGRAINSKGSFSIESEESFTSIYMGIGNVAPFVPFMQSANRNNLAVQNLALNPNGGNVGINQSSPTEKLDVVGNGKFSGTITASPATASNELVTKAQLDANSGRPYKSYVALLSQTGTNAPVATVLENTLGGTVVWTRTGVGFYEGTLSGAFIISKTVCFHQRSTDGVSSSPFDYSVSSEQANQNKILIRNTLGGSPGDGLLTRSSIEIRVYN